MGESYRFRLGDFDCIAINDGNFTGRAEVVFAHAPQSEMTRLLQSKNLEPDRLAATQTCLFVDTGTYRVLIDTGLGAGVKPDSGKLLRTLLSNGINPSDVDVVILTHGHGDHIGGAVDDNGEVTFSKARFVLWKEEWRFWTSDAGLKQVSESAAGFARRKLPPLASLIETLDAEQDAVPGIRALAAPGHTVGHIALQIESQDERLIYLADTALHPIQVEHPHWCARVDQNLEQTVASRIKIFHRAAAADALVLAFHFPPFPSLGYIRKIGMGWKWEPITPS
jgi:glyoxylase-like metal-dependent hydrolase (beta-lactamase superfamily II)